MAESKRVYEIRINGIQESYEGVKSLREALSGLTDTVINVSNEEQKTSETRKSTASSTDALAKAQEKLNNYDRAYQEELAKVNAELSANKKEINDALKLQQAQDVVDAKQLDTYAQKQQYLSALNTLIRNHSTATEEDTQAIDRMVQESAALQAELKATDEQMQIHVRNVGNYNEAADRVVDANQSLKSELKSVTAQMADMLYNGVSQSDKAFVELAKKSGELKDAWQDAQEAVRRYSSDTRTMDNIINMATSAVNAYQLYNSTLVLFGKENEDAAESMQKMMAVMTVLNSLQQVQNSLLENGTATARLYHKGLDLIRAALGLKKKATEEDKVATEGSTKANNLNQASEEKDAAAKKLNAAASKTEKAATDQSTLSTQKDTIQKGLNEQATNKMSVAQRAGAVASKTLSTALRAIPLMFIIGLVVELISRWEEIWNWLRKTFPVLDKVGKKFDEMGGFVNAAKSYLIGLVDFIKNSVMATIEGLWNLLVDFFSDWSKLSEDWNKMGEKVGQAWGDGMKKAHDTAQEGITRKQKEEELKRLKQQKDYLDITERNYKTHSKKYRKLQEDIYKAEQYLAKDDADKRHEIDVQYYRDRAELRDQDAKAAEEAAKARKDAAEKAKKEYEKLLENAKKDVDETEKLSNETSKRRYKADGDNLKRQQEQYSKHIQFINSKYVKLVKQLDKAGKKVSEISEIIIDAEKNGMESEAALLQGYMNEAQRYQNAISGLIEQNNSDYLKNLDNIERLVADRMEFAVNQVALEAQEIKKNYDEVIKKLEKDLNGLKKKAETQTGDELKKTNDAIANATRALDDARKSLKTELGEYANNLDFVIPVEIDVENIEKNYKHMRDDLGYNMKFSLTQAVGAVLGVNGVLETFYNDALERVKKKVKQDGKEVSDEVLSQMVSDELFVTFRDLGAVLGFAKGELETMGKDIKDYAPQLQKFLGILMDDRPFKEKSKQLQEFISTTMQSIDISKFGLFSQQASDEVKSVADETIQFLTNAYNTFVAQQDKIISFSEKAIKRFQDSTKEFNIEPVMQDDFMSGLLKGQIINLDETKKRYDTLKDSYTAYAKTLEKGSKEREAYEEAWQQKLTATMRQRDLIGNMYGKESQEYKNASMEYMLLVEDKKAADKAYAAEHEKAMQKVDEITEKSKNLMYDYIESIANRFADITKTIQDNVMNPIFDGLSDLFAFQLEEAKEALDEITELYDKAVEAREQSAERMKEINEELRNDDGQNKEELQQRLAEEEVLLVQREEAERALEKEKKKRKYEVDVADAKQRKFELQQKLIEGLVNTALGVTAALKYGFPMGPIFAAIIGAMGALQTAIISKQIGNVKMPQKYAAGGKVGEDGVSRSHKQGGHRIEDTNIEVEGGEWVINKASSKKYDSLLKSINDDNVRLVRKQIEIIKEKRIVERPNRIALMADGGQINTLAATRAVKENNEIAAISELIKQIDFQPTVSVVDINKVSKRLVRVQDLSGKAV